MSHCYGKRLSTALPKGKEIHPAQQGCDDQETGCDVFRRLVTDLLAEQACNQKTGEREEDDKMKHVVCRDESRPTLSSC